MSKKKDARARAHEYRKSAGLHNNKKKRTPRKETIWKLVKRAFSHERNGIVNVSTFPLITERLVKLPTGQTERQIISFMVTLPRWISEKRILEAVNLGFGFLAEEVEG